MAATILLKKIMQIIKKYFVFCDSRINRFNAGSELVLSDGRRLTLTACGCLWWKHGSENLFHQAARESSPKHH